MSSSTAARFSQNDLRSIDISQFLWRIKDESRLILSVGNAKPSSYFVYATWGKLGKCFADQRRGELCPEETQVLDGLSILQT